MPDKDQTSDVIAHEAIAWYIRLKDVTATDANRKLFQEWLKADPRHGCAYEEAQRLWTQLQEPAAELGASGWHRPARSRSFVYQSLAAAAAIVLAVVFMWWRDPGLVDRAFADYATMPGQRQEVTLADGTHASFDGDSAITVSITHTTRQVRLLRGRVWFDVAPHQASNFHVIAGDVETRVLGTAFAVERAGEAVIVTVERGHVALTGDRNKLTVVLMAGQRVRVTSGASASPEIVDPEITLAWRRGVLVFDRASLAMVVEELDRMTAGRVLVTDDALRRLPVSGVFRTDDAEAMLEALRNTFGVKTTTILGLVTLIHR